MSTREEFKEVFIIPMAQYFGTNKLPGIKLEGIFERIGHYPAAVLGKAAKNIILKLSNSTVPDIDRIMEFVNEANATRNYSQSEAMRRIADKDCCRGTGRRQVNGRAYRCHCEAGIANFPSWPVYQGQAEFKEKSWSETVEGVEYIITENQDYIHTRPRFPGSIRDFSFVLKGEGKK